MTDRPPHLDRPRRRASSRWALAGAVILVLIVGGVLFSEGVFDEAPVERSTAEDVLVPTTAEDRADEAEVTEAEEPPMPAAEAN
jgi:hypothetical protein